MSVPVPPVELHAEVDQPLQGPGLVDETGQGGGGLGCSDVGQLRLTGFMWRENLLGPLDNFHGVVPVVGQVLHVLQAVVKHGLNVGFSDGIIIIVKFHFKLLWSVLFMMEKRGRELSEAESVAPHPPAGQVTEHLSIHFSLVGLRSRNVLGLSTFADLKNSGTKWNSNPKPTSGMRASLLLLLITFALKLVG